MKKKEEEEVKYRKQGEPGIGKGRWYLDFRVWEEGRWQYGSIWTLHNSWGTNLSCYLLTWHKTDHISILTE